jgi:D-methionine transport system ATP-binding protein
VVDGQEVSSLGEKELSVARQRIGMIFQQFNLLYSRNVYKNVAYPLRLAGLPKDKVLDRVEQLLDFVGLTDKALQYPSRLSGGQKQRVGIARALANSPDILISDEATSALDPQTTGEVLELLQRVNREFGVTILLVTHEMDVIRSIANKVAVMENGEVIEQGSAYDVFSNPQDPTTRRFVGSVLHHLPSPETIARIREVHRGHLVQVHLENRESNDPFLSRVARTHNVDFNIIYGGVSELQARLFGSLTVELLGTDAAIASTVADLRAVTTVTELSHA